MFALYCLNIIAVCSCYSMEAVVLQLVFVVFFSHFHVFSPHLVYVDATDMVDVRYVIDCLFCRKAN